MDRQLIINSTPGPTPPTFRVNDAAPAPVAVLLHPGARFRIFTDAEGAVTGIVTYHETTAPDGSTQGHENDYSFRPARKHTDFVQISGQMAEGS